MFKITPKQLAPLFQPQKIRDGSSIYHLKQLGGYESLQGLLITSFKEGLNESSSNLKQRVKVYGENKPVSKNSKTFWKRIISNFEDDTLRILFIVALAVLILGIKSKGIQEGWIEGASILIGVLVVVIVASGNDLIIDWLSAKSRVLNAQNTVKVLKNGEWIKILENDTLVGDIQYLEAGSALTVDGILIEGQDLIVDESSITGEAEPIKKAVPKNYSQGQDCFLLSGSKVLEGNGIMVIAAVGRNSYYGSLTHLLQKQEDLTQLQQNLCSFTDRIGRIGMLIALAIFLCMIGHNLYDVMMSENFVGQYFIVQTLHQIVSAFSIAFSIFFFAVPEGLPLSLVYIWANSVGKTRQQGILIKQLKALQAMGVVDYILSDKTGTMTKNALSVVKLFALGNLYSDFTPKTFPKLFTKILSKSICQNSSATPEFIEEASELHVNEIGNKTECALLELAYKLGYNYKEHRNQEQIIKTFPFSSAIKSTTTVSQIDDKIYTFTRGASESLLSKCSHFVDKNGNLSLLTQEWTEILKQNLSDFSNRNLRTILLTYKEGEFEHCQEDDLPTNLIILGMAGIKDTLRDGVQQVITQCQSLGVKIRMITGDNLNAAITIAKQAGILSSNYNPEEGDCVTMTGRQFHEYVGGLVRQEIDETETVGNIQNFKKIQQNLRVLARSSPEGKYLLATGLQQLGHTVAITGDGTSDAPALKKADAGLAMGISGTEVAKQASGIILLDDNFKSILTAIKWGRNVFESVRKLLQFQLTVVIVTLILSLIGAIVLQKPPLNSIQLFWTYLIMDVVAIFALVTESPTDKQLKDKPYSRKMSLITPEMWRNIITQATLQLIILGAILFQGPEIFDIKSSIGLQISDWHEKSGKHYCIFYNVFILLQIFNLINARKLQSSELNVFAGILNNILFIIAMVVAFIVQFLCIQFGGKIMKTVPLTIEEHFICFWLGSLSIWTGFIFKLLIPVSLFKNLCNYG